VRWKVEFITEDSSNVLVDDPSSPDTDKECVGMGFPLKLAERLVSLHNQDVPNGSVSSLSAGGTVDELVPSN